MHRTLDDAVETLVGSMPTVAPVAEDELIGVAEGHDDITLPADPEAPAEGLDAIRRGLQEAIDRLQQVADQIRELERKKIIPLFLRENTEFTPLHRIGFFPIMYLSSEASGLNPVFFQKRA